MKRSSPRKGRLVSTSTLLGIFGITYLCGVGYFLHITTHNHDNSENEDSAVERDFGAVVGDINNINFDNPAEVKMYRKIRYEKALKRPPNNGPGEGGNAVHLNATEQKEADRRFAKETFNVVASDKIAMDRTVRDTRDPGCKSLNYDDVLPTASVVIIYCNEAFTPLVRTAHSIINRTPPQYLQEIIFVDDYSDRPELKEPLKKYVQETWPDGIVKMIRTDGRSGLIRARLAGAAIATGDVLVFLDAHCEVNDRWMEPMLQRIKEKRSAVVCPEIDVINANTLVYNTGGGGAVGGFWWSLHFSWRPIPPQERARRSLSTDPIRLEPMLQRIKDKRSAVVCPEIDVIDARSLMYNGVGGGSVGGFWWSLHFSWRPMPPQERMRRTRSTDPIRLEPMLARIKEKRTAVLCPMIDAINDKSLEYSGNGGVAVGGFMWSGHFTWRAVPDSEKARRKYDTDPVRSPTMAGGLFAADRKYFYEIGGYDEGMEVWGGENLEISFRTWMCGGSLEFIPCSRVGHIFRAAHPYSFGNKDTHGLNSKRLAEVWMDEYKRLFYGHRHDLLDKDAGDISGRVALRKRLGCKSFKWYLENVYPEKFIPDENVQAHGYIRNPESSMCIDTLSKDEKKVFNVGVYSCQGGKSANQVFSLGLTGEFRREEACMDAQGNHGAKVALYPCHGNKGNQLFTHDRTEGTIKHSSNLCLDVGGLKNGDELVLQPCSGAASQKFEFENYLTSQ